MYNIELDCKKLNASELTISNEWSLHPFHQPISDILLNSLQTSGVLHPPIVKKRGDNYELVCGRKRVEFLLQNGFSSISTQVIPDTTSILTQLQIILSDQLLSSPLTMIERAFFIKIASKHLTNDQILSYFSSQLPCKRHDSSISEHLRLLEIDDSILSMIHNNVLSEQTATLLMTVNKKDQLTLSQLISYLRPGGGKQKRILTMLQDLSHRHGETITTYIEEKDIQEILQHENMNPPQKVQQLMELLQTKITPNLHKTQIDFKRESQSLNLPTGVELTPSQSFEKNDVFLTIKFSNLNEVKSKWSKIQQIIYEN